MPIAVNPRGHVVGHCGGVEGAFGRIGQYRAHTVVGGHEDKTFAVGTVKEKTSVKSDRGGVDHSLVQYLCSHVGYGDLVHRFGIHPSGETCCQNEGSNDGDDAFHSVFSLFNYNSLCSNVISVDEAQNICVKGHFCYLVPVGKVNVLSPDAFEW